MTAHAHVPFIEGRDYPDDGTFTVTNPEQSKAVYAYLDGPDDVDVFTIDVSEPLRIDVHTLVPFCTELADFAVRAALIGPGLPAAKLPLPVALADGDGALLSEERLGSGQSRNVTHEQFSNRDYFSAPTVTVESAQPGRYRFVVWHPEGRAGDYVAVIGKLEEFGPADIVKATRNTVTLRREGELHGTCTPPAR